MIPIDIKLLNSACMPSCSTVHNAGYDLRINLPQPRLGITLGPGDQVKVGAGFSMHIKDPAFFGLIVPRSGLGTAGIVIANGSGVIDSNYTGEIMLTLLNRSKKTISLEHLDRVAQMLILPVLHADWQIVEEHTESARGSKGFGSTGVK